MRSRRSGPASRPRDTVLVQVPVSACDGLLEGELDGDRLFWDVEGCFSQKSEASSIFFPSKISCLPARRVSSVEEDEENVKALIKATIGFREVDHKIEQFMLNWVAGEVDVGGVKLDELCGWKLEFCNTYTGV